MLLIPWHALGPRVSYTCTIQMVGWVLASEHQVTFEPSGLTRSFCRRAAPHTWRSASLTSQPFPGCPEQCDASRHYTLILCQLRKQLLPVF